MVKVLSIGAAMLLLSLLYIHLCSDLMLSNKRVDVAKDFQREYLLEKQLEAYRQLQWWQLKKKYKMLKFISRI